MRTRQGSLSTSSKVHTYICALTPEKMTAICTAGPADLPQLALIFDAYRRYYGQPAAVEAAHRFLAERMQQGESVILIAEAEGQVVDFTQLYPIFTSLGLKKSLLLNDLFVDEAWRKRGIATQLLEAAKRVAAERACQWLMLQTAMDNYTAQSVYEKNGWQKVEDFLYQYNL